MNPQTAQTGGAVAAAATALSSANFTIKATECRATPSA
jgi:hypothetical protein